MNWRMKDRYMINTKRGAFCSFPFISNFATLLAARRTEYIPITSYLLSITKPNIPLTGWVSKLMLDSQSLQIEENLTD